MKLLSLNKKETDLQPEAEPEKTEKSREKTCFRCCGACPCQSQLSRVENAPLTVIRLAVSAVMLFVASFQIGARMAEAFYAAAFLIAGYDILYTGVYDAVVSRSPDLYTITGIAGIAAFAAGSPRVAVLCMMLTRLFRLIEEKTIGKFRASFQKKTDLRPDAVSVVRGDEPQTVQAADVKKGDLVYVLPGERFPFDGYIVSGDTEVDTSALTGDPIPREAKMGADVVSGTLNLTVPVTVKVMHPPEESVVSRIFRMAEEFWCDRGEFGRIALLIAKYFPFFTLLLAFLTAGLGMALSHQPLIFWVRRAITVFALGCPCAAAVPPQLSYAAGFLRAFRNGILIKNPSSADRLRKTTQVLFDKTGTLTTGEFEIEYLETADGVSEPELLNYAAYAECLSGNPLSAAICRACESPLDKTQIVNVREVRGKGLAIALKEGSLVFAGTYEFLLGLKIGGLVRPCETTCVLVAKNRKYLGTIYLRDTVKTSSRAAVDAFSALKIEKKVMLTDDRAAAAERISDSVGIRKYVAECFPQDKLNFMKNLKVSKITGETVLLVGDRVRDTTLFPLADAAVSMGGLGTETCVRSCDAMILDDAPEKAAMAVAISQKMCRAIRIRLAAAAAVKGILLALAIMGYLNLWMAVSADLIAVLVLTLLSVQVSGEHGKSAKKTKKRKKSREKTNPEE